MAVDVNVSMSTIYLHMLDLRETGDLSKVYPGQVDGKKHTADLMHVWQVEQAAVMLTKPGFFEWPILIEK